jgi:membrane-associated phospholipid phosphatase
LDILPAVSRFFQDFFRFLPTMLPLWLGAWVGCLIVLILCLRGVKSTIRPHVRSFDEAVTKWARTLRYQKAIEPAEPLEALTDPLTRREEKSERLSLTWFFRFCTNFGSSPSLGALSLLIAIWAFRAPEGGPPVAVEAARWWFLPGLSFTGGMWLSWVTKRVFKRLRPDRDAGDFGHKMRDPSFPSGHSLTGVCFWGMIVVSLLHLGAAPAIIIACGVLGLTMVLLTGLSRVYLGVHFPSDVAGGYFIAVVWSIVCYLALRTVL